MRGGVHFNKTRLGSTDASNKGTCSIKVTMRRDPLEAIAFDELQPVAGSLPQDAVTDTARLARLGEVVD